MSDEIVLDKELLFDVARKSKGTVATEFVFIVLINVLAFSLFILFFFFVMTAKVEQDVVKKSVTDLVSEFSEELKMFLPADQLPAIAQALKNFKLPDMSNADKQVEDQNAKLKKQALVVLGSAAAGVAALVIVWFFVMRAVVRKGNPTAQRGIAYPDMRKVGLVTGFSFIAVAITEFVFLYTVAARFKPLDKNKVKVAMLEALMAKAAKQ